MNLWQLGHFRAVCQDNSALWGIGGRPPRSCKLRSLGPILTLTALNWFCYKGMNYVSKVSYVHVGRLGVASENNQHEKRLTKIGYLDDVGGCHCQVRPVERIEMTASVELGRSLLLLSPVENCFRHVSAILRNPKGHRHHGLLNDLFFHKIT